MALLETQTTHALRDYKKHLDAKFLIHTQNLARADMPGARALEVEPFAKHLRNKAPVGMRMTHGQHLQGRGGPPHARVRTNNDTASMTLSGNNIDEEREMAEVARVGAQRRGVTELQKKTVQLFNLLMR